MQKARRHGTRPLRPLVGRRFQVLFHSPSGVLFTFPSPLLGESRLISFPRATEMFHFARLPSPCLCVQHGMTPHYQRRVCPFGNPRIRGCSAPTRGLSQPSTPFFGSWCQGIHHLPLLS